MEVWARRWRCAHGAKQRCTARCKRTDGQQDTTALDALSLAAMMSLAAMTLAATTSMGVACHACEHAMSDSAAKACYTRGRHETHSAHTWYASRCA